MANSLYNNARNLFLRGDLQWKVGGHTFKVFLINTQYYTFDINHNYLSSVPTTARAGNSGGTGDANAVTLTIQDPSAGIADASNIVFTSVPGTVSYEAVIIYRSTGVEGTSPLVAFIDTMNGLPIISNGGNINLDWSNLTNKIFKL